jgi:hypothetical protein
VAVLIKLQFDVGSAGQAQSAVRGVHEEVARLNLATTQGVMPTAQFHQEISHAGAAMVATEGNTRLLRGALITLAEQGTGTTGVFGKLAAGLLVFGGGTPLILGVAGGLAIAGLAVHALGEESRQAAKFALDHSAALAALARVQITNKPTETASEIGLNRDRLGQLQTKLTQALSLQHFFGPGAAIGTHFDLGTYFPTIEPGTTIREAIIELRAQIATMTAQLREAAGGPVMMPTIDVVTTERLRLGRMGRLDPGALNTSNLRTIAPDIRGPRSPFLGGNGFEFEGREGIGVMASQLPLPLPRRAAEQIHADVSRIAVSVFSGIAALMAGGGPGAAFSGIGGILSAIPGLGLAGTFVAGFGSLIGAFGHDGMPVKVTNLKDLVGIQQPARTQLLIVDSSGRPIERLMYDIGRRDVRDVNPRLPVTAGA